MSAHIEASPNAQPDSLHPGAPLTILDLRQAVGRLVELYPQGVCKLDHVFPKSVTFDERIIPPLQRWSMSKTSALLYLESEGLCGQPRMPQLAVAASVLLDRAHQAKIPTLSFFCGVVPSPRSLQSCSIPFRTPLALLYSLIHQLSRQIPQATEIGHILTSTELATLDASPSSWPKALRLFSQLLTFAPPMLLCVVDSYHALDPRAEVSPWTHELLNVLKQNMRVEGKVFKILFTNSSRGHSLLKEIPIQNVVIINGVKKDSW